MVAVIIGIDIDGVLFPWSDAANAAVVSQFGVPDPGPHVTWYHIKNALTSEQWQWLWGAEGQEIVFSQVGRVYPGVVAEINSLLRDPENKCHFVTHRDPRRTAVHTAAFLTQHFGDHPWAGVHVVQNSVEKHALMAWDLFLDDKPETVLSMLENTEALVLSPVRPWNEELAEIQSPRLVHYADPSEISASLG